MDPYQLEPANVLKELGSDSATGLPTSEAERRLNTFGPNALTGSGAPGPWRIAWEQLTGLMTVILIVAALISAALGDLRDAVAIGAIVVLNTLLGFTQEYRAEKAMAALKKLAVPSVHVRRDGHTHGIPASQLVPGDIVLIEAGNLVAADCRLLEAASLQTLEATLTGESEPIRKITAAISAESVPLGDRLNSLYMGTFVTAGRGLAVVTRTGMQTELGRIASLLHTVPRTATPLQARLGHLGRWLAGAALVIVLVICALGLLRGEDPELLFLTAISLGVAAVPEGLPAVVTIALTLGAQRMLKQRVLIRRLPAVETLGSVTVICTDKTGTLTENRMTAAVLAIAGEELTLPPGDSSHNPDYGLLLTVAVLCNDAASSTLGNPTETALVAAAESLGLSKSNLDQAMPRTTELPFSPERKRMTTVHRVRVPGPLLLPDSLRSRPHIACTKGAVAGLLQISTHLWANGDSTPLTTDLRDQILNRDEQLAKSGLRVLGVAVRALDALPSAGTSPEQDLTFIGMVGILDPPRPEVRDAVAKCLSAGIRPVMITGDHPATAQSIAAQVGIETGPRIVTGPDLDQMSAVELEQLADTVNVYTRVSPEHKLRIVDALQRRGHVVAMTGDGVNDAPALRKANIGVAMGITGTDVAKEAAGMVILDDNFATIVSAVEEGRVIYDNTRKFIRYILATNSAEIWVMLAAPFFGMPLPLLPLQILWMNLVTDGLPALALGVEPAEPDTMRRAPLRPAETIFSRGLGWHVAWVGTLMGSLSLAIGWWFWQANDPAWQTLLFTTLTFSQMAHILAIRSERHLAFAMGSRKNVALIAAVLLTVTLQLALLYAPILQSVFSTTALSSGKLLLTATSGALVFSAVELEKLVTRNKRGDYRSERPSI